MRFRDTVLALLMTAFVPVVACAQAHAHDHTSPYAGFGDRDIKALSAEEVAGLLAGEGLGLALPGELNGYPGPRHVLDMAPMLGLDPEQVNAIEAIFDEMQSDAQALGREIVEQERRLDRAFAEGTLTEERLAELTASIGEARGRLRMVHLSAHLRLRPLLTDAQRERYQRARGYGG